MANQLGDNRYGKSENRVFRVSRDGEVHSVLDFNVSVRLSGAFSATHLSGDNAAVLPTDTQKNTVFALMQKHGPLEAEAFGIILAKHFLENQQHVTVADIKIESFTWNRVICEGTPHPRAFRRDGTSTRIATVTGRNGKSGPEFRVTSGVEGLILLKTSDSEFSGYQRDSFTTLAETTDRMMATVVSARWRHHATTESSLATHDWKLSHSQAVSGLEETFAAHHSLSLQHTLYAMGNNLLGQLSALDSIHLTLPNRHHFLVDLSSFGQTNDNEVYLAADRPYGCIEAVVHRDGVSTELLPPW